MKCVSLLICLMAFSTSFARQNAEISTPNTLNGQYKALSADCDLVDGFRVMKLYKMDQFWKSVQDSVHKKQQAITNMNTIASQQKTEINQLKALLAKSETEKAELVSKVDNILVFGKLYSKSGFTTFVFSLVIGLVVLIVVLALMYKISFGSARELRNFNETIYHEFEEYKHQAVEKQIKLSRELQNYRNQMADLKRSA